MASWRPMTEADIAGVVRVGDEIHRALPESESVYRERLQLFPEGCLVLARDADSEVGGYVVSFPIRGGRPPALNAALGGIAPDADQYYIHDLAVLPSLRGRGAAAEGVGRVLAVAERYKYPTTCLISVYGTVPFWRRFGFVPGPVDDALGEKLRGYGPDATYLVRENS